MGDWCGSCCFCLECKTTFSVEDYGSRSRALQARDLHVCSGNPSCDVCGKSFPIGRYSGIDAATRACRDHERSHIYCQECGLGFPGSIVTATKALDCHRRSCQVQSSEQEQTSDEERDEDLSQVQSSEQEQTSDEECDDSEQEQQTSDEECGEDLNCEFCGKSFPVEKYAGNFTTAKTACQSHQDSHIRCQYCRESFIGSKIEAMIERDEHEETCRDNGNETSENDRVSEEEFSEENNSQGSLIPELQCFFCNKTFPELKYRNYEAAHLARFNHQNSHIGCDLCGRIFSPDDHGSKAEATRVRNGHLALCGVNDDSEETDEETEHEEEESADEEEGILLGVTKVDKKFCLVAWHCGEQRPFRPLSEDGFWSLKQLKELNLPPHTKFRFRRHPSQTCDLWKGHQAHQHDNIRISGARDCMSVPSLPSPIVGASIRSLFRLDRDLKATSPHNYLAVLSSFAVVRVRGLNFVMQSRLRCNFIDMVSGDKYVDVPVVNARMQSKARWQLPATKDFQTIVLGLSREHEGRYQLLFDAMIPDELCE